MNFLGKTIRHNAGMSLVEILVALTLMGIAMAFVTGKIMDRLEEGKQQATIINIKSIGSQLQDFRRHCGRYPKSTDGLQALVANPGDCKRYAPGGYIEGGRIPQDAWDTDFEYESDGKKYKITSYGSDQEPGGEGYDADLISDEI